MEKLHDLLTRYHKIILMIEPYPKLVFSSDFCVTQKMIVISYSNIVINVKNIDFMELTKEEINEIIQLYTTYEFSDRLKIITETSHFFAPVINLRNNGILSDEEVTDIIFR